MRRLPKKKSDKHRLIIKACHDYFGTVEKVRANQIALWIMNRRKGVKLTEEEKSDLWEIQCNLKDETYIKNLV